MIALIGKWIASFFTADKIGCLFRKLLFISAKTVVSEIMKPENQKKAYEFVKELNKRTDMTNIEKAKEFNRQMFEWAKKMGKKMTESVVNCLRELAVNALKVEKAEAEENGEECDCCVDKTESEDA